MNKIIRYCSVAVLAIAVLVFFPKNVFADEPAQQMTPELATQAAAAAQLMLDAQNAALAQIAQTQAAQAAQMQAAQAAQAQAAQAAQAQAAQAAQAQAAQAQAAQAAQAQAAKAAQAQAAQAAQAQALQAAQAAQAQAAIVPGEEVSSAAGSNTYVDVNLSTQTLTYFVNGSPVLSTPCVTGSPGRSTPRGVFAINSRIPGKYLKGPTWNVWVNRWMRFAGNVGIHDASWRKSFGGNIYRSNGSHGCVNIPFAAADQLYNMVTVGTIVVVH